MLVTSIFSFSNNVFKRRLCQGRYKCDKELIYSPHPQKETEKIQAKQKGTCLALSSRPWNKSATVNNAIRRASCRHLSLHTLSHHKFSASSKLRVFAADNFNVTPNFEFVFPLDGKHYGKMEKMLIISIFSFFHNVFKKAFSTRVSKVVIFKVKR